MGLRFWRIVVPQWNRFCYEFRSARILRYERRLRIQHSNRRIFAYPCSIPNANFSFFTTSTKEGPVEFVSALKPKLKEQLQKYLQHYEQIQRRLSEEATSLPPKELIKLSKESAALAPLIDVFKDYKSKFNELEDLKKVLVDSQAEPELVKLAREEARKCQIDLKQLEEKILFQLIPKEDTDEGAAVLEIRAGTGGLEASLFAWDLFKMYQNFAHQKGWEFEVLSHSTSDLGGTREVIVSIRGDGAFGRLKYESGVHRVQRIPQTDTTRIHTSTATVAVLPELPPEGPFQLRQEDLKIDVYRAGGAGGQHVNRTESAVRITHIPTGVVVAIQDDRSQHLNKAKALKILQARVYALELQQKQNERAAQRKSQIGTGDRSEKIRTYNFSQDRITDHRCGITHHDIQAMLNGELLDIIHEELMKRDREITLQNLLDEN